MQSNDERYRLRYRGGGFGARAQSLLVRVLAIATSAVLLAGAIAISMVVFAVALTVLSVVGVYLWWKTRELRKQMRARQHDASIIEGETVRDDDERSK